MISPTCFYFNEEAAGEHGRESSPVDAQLSVERQPLIHPMVHFSVESVQVNMQVYLQVCAQLVISWNEAVFKVF